MTIHKILKYLAIVIGVIGLILLARIIMAGDDTIAASTSAQQSYLAPIMWLSYLVFGITLILILFFVIKGLFFRGNLKRTLISVGAFVLIVVIAYLVTDGSQMELRDGEILSASASHWVSAGLVIFYILAVIAVGAMVLSGIRKLVKRT